MMHGAKLAWGVILLAAILHFDFWNWDSTAVVFGFVPVGLAYHAGISIAAAIGWFLVVRLDWPDRVEEWSSAGETGPEERR
jgi:hypothetical protein